MLINEQSRPITPHERRKLAVLAFTDPRTVAKYLRGRVVRSTTAARIEAALVELRRQNNADPPENVPTT